MLIKILNETIHTQNKWCSILSKDKVDLAHLSVFSTNVNFDKFYSVSKLPKKMKQSHLHNTLYTTLPGKKKKKKKKKKEKRCGFLTWETEVSIMEVVGHFSFLKMCRSI